MSCNTPEATLPERYYTQLSGRLTSWQKWLAKDSSFNQAWSDYIKIGKTTSFHSLRTPGSIDSIENFRLYAPFFLYNEDSSLAINLFPNLVFKESDGKTYCIGSWEPEESYDLVNFRTKTSEQIYSAGTPTFFDDGIWLTKTTAAIVGVDRLYPDERYYRPFIMIVDVADSIVTQYSALDSILYPGGSYVREIKLQDVDFESKSWDDFPEP